MSQEIAMPHLVCIVGGTREADAFSVRPNALVVVVVAAAAHVHVLARCIKRINPPGALKSLQAGYLPETSPFELPHVFLNAQNKRSIDSKGKAKK